MADKWSILPEQSVTKVGEQDAVTPKIKRKERDRERRGWGGVGWGGQHYLGVPIPPWAQILVPSLSVCDLKQVA